MKVSAVIMAAGQSKRMKSARPKVLHTLLGKPLIEYALDVVNSISDEKPVVILGHGAEEVKKVIGDRALFALQNEQLGTADAVNSARSLLESTTDLVVVISADMPLLRAETIQYLVEIQKNNSGPISMLTLVSPDSRGFGRVVRSLSGEVVGIVEEKVAAVGQLAINELNASIYCFKSDWLWKNLQKVNKSVVGEYYLTDLVGIAADQGFKVQAVRIEDPEEAMGINTRVHLAEAEAILRRRVNTEWMLNGVTMLDPTRVYIEKDVTIGKDTILFPDTYLKGKTSIADGCEIGPNTLISDTQIGNHCHIQMAVMENAIIEDGVSMGPFVHLRSGAHLAKGVHMGNFGEVKNSYLGPGVKMGHFSYIGDATIGENVNISAGVITCNFDGKKKNRTEIGANAFIGSDTMLRAPLKIGEGAYTGAGSVVTHDVAPHEVVAGVPARPLKSKKNDTSTLEK